jgi:hypothetical protein
MKIGKHVFLCTVGILIASAALLLPQKASGIGALSGTWSCGASGQIPGSGVTDDPRNSHHQRQSS